MDAYKNLPAPLKIGIPAALVLVIGLLAYMMLLKPEPEVELITTQDMGVIETSKTVLEDQQVEFTSTNEGDMFTLSVAGHDATDAATALAKSGIKDRTGLAKKIKCPAAPGFTATRAANERADNCSDASMVQTMLLTAGAIAANVSVSQQDNETLLGPEKSKNVVAQVFLPPQMKGKWNAEQAASTIARTVGTSMDRVSITDDHLQTMFDGSLRGKAGSGGASLSGGPAAAIGSLGCGDIAGATEVETKRTAVRACFEGTIGAKLTELLGGSDRYVLSVEPTIDSVARTTTSIRNTRGPIVDRSTQSGSGSRVDDISSPPNTSETMSSDPAGDISSLRINVVLDRNVVTDDQMAAVKSLLSAYRDARRGDPAPVVKMSKFANGAGDAPVNEELEQIQKTAAMDEQSTTSNPPAPDPETPKWVMALIAVLVIGIATMALVLWRRGGAMAAERARLEESFAREQRLFEDFAQQNPDQLASDLNALFGAPSAPEPTMRA